MPKDFISLIDWPSDALLKLLARAAELKDLLKRGERPQTLRGRTLALYFEKPSLRTHVTFEAGMTQLGGHAILLRPEQVGMGTRETPADVARNLSRWVDGLVARTFSHPLVEELARVASIPVINALTDLLHPCQVLADLQTIAEHADFKQAKLAYVGDGNNMANSLLNGCAVLGLDLALATPSSHRPSPRVRNEAEAVAKRSGANLSWSVDPVEAVRDAHFVYTDVWASMGQEAESEERKKIFVAYQLNRELLSHAPEARILHCLPAHRGEEITDEVLDSPQSLVFDQAENRLHSQKAILEALLGSTLA